MSDAEERARFDAWWLGDYGPYGIRAEWPSSQTEAAWMAWKAQAENVERLRSVLQRVRRWGPPMVRGYIDGALGGKAGRDSHMVDGEVGEIREQEEKDDQTKPRI